MRFTIQILHILLQINWRLEVNVTANVNFIHTNFLRQCWRDWRSGDERFYINMNLTHANLLETGNEQRLCQCEFYI